MAIFDYNPSAITPFPYWRWNKVLPAVYDDSVSQYEMLCRLLSVVNNIIESTNSTGEQVEALTQLVQQLIDGGFPSGLVEYVNQMVDAAMADDVAAMNATIAALQEQVNSFDQSIQAQVDSLFNTVRNSSVRNDCILLLGDSYAQGVHSASATTSGDNWMNILINRMGLTDVYKYLGGSGGFYHTTTSTNGSSSPVPIGTNYQGVLQHAYEYINGLGRANDVKHIVIQGGVNDGTSLINGIAESAVLSATNECLNAVRSWFPNAKIHVVYTCVGSTSFNIVGERSFVIPTVYNNSAAQHGCSYNQFTNAPWVFNEASYDGTHPTEGLQSILAGFIGCILENGHCNDVITTANRGGIIISIKADHTAVVQMNMQEGISVDGTWTGESFIQVLEPNPFRILGTRQVIFPGIGTVETGGQYVMQFGWRVDGSILWRSKGDASSNHMTWMYFTPMVFRIG